MCTWRALAVVVLVPLALGLWSISAFATTAHEPTGEEVIQKFIEVTGGKDAYTKLKSRVSTGTIAMAQQGMSGTMTIYQQAPNLTRVVGNVGAVTFDRGFDGQVAFEVNSMTGTRIIEGDERDLMQQQSLSSPLIDLSKYFTDIENVGAEQIDGHDAWKVELTMKNGEKLQEWFDSESGLLVQMLMNMDSPMGKLEITINPSDWKTVDGVKVPLKMKQLIQPIGIEQTIEFTKVQNNLDIPADKFELPEDVKSFLKETGATQPSTQPAGDRK